MKKLAGQLAVVAVVSFLTACGTTGTASSPTTPTVAGGLTASSTAGLQKAFTRVHRAIFDKLDGNKDGWLDEYEVGKHMTMAEFQKADKKDGWGSAGRLSRTEFTEWATRTFLWFNQDKEGFANSFRGALAKAFNRLDANRDGLLVRTEVSMADLSRLRLSFEYPKLRIQEPIKKVTPEMFAAADKTGDGKLSQAEFEDLYIELVVLALGGSAAAPAPAPAPPAPPVAPAPPAPAPAAGKAKR